MSSPLRRSLSDFDRNRLGPKDDIATGASPGHTRRAGHGLPCARRGPLGERACATPSKQRRWTYMFSRNESESFGFRRFHSMSAMDQGRPNEPQLVYRRDPETGQPVTTGVPDLAPLGDRGAAGSRRDQGMRGARLDAGPRRSARPPARFRHRARGTTARSFAASGSGRHRRGAGFGRRQLSRMPAVLDGEHATSFFRTSRFSTFLRRCRLSCHKGERCGTRARGGTFRRRVGYPQVLHCEIPRRLNVDVSVAISGLRSSQ